MHYEPIVLTVFDFAMIISVIAGLFLIPAFLLNQTMRSTLPANVLAAASASASPIQIM